MNKFSITILDMGSPLHIEFGVECRADLGRILNALELAYAGHYAGLYPFYGDAAFGDLGKPKTYEDMLATFD